MTDWLPAAPGYLPKWQLVVASLALFNSLQNFATISLTRKLYTKTTQVNQLSARTFGVWTLLSAIVRLYCAYNISNKPIYDLTLWSYAIAFGHFASEILFFRTAGLSVPVMSPVIVSTTSLTWMLLQRDFYLAL